MTKSSENAIRGLREALTFVQGEDVPGARVHLGIDVPTIRERTGLSQAEFAELIEEAEATVADWESGRRNPAGPARMLLMMLERTRR